MSNFPNLDYRANMEGQGMGPLPESNLGQPEATQAPYGGSEDPNEMQQGLWSSVNQQNKIAQSSETISEAQTAAATPSDSSTWSESSTTESLPSSTTSSTSSSTSSTSTSSSTSSKSSTASTSSTSSTSSESTTATSSTTSTSLASTTPYESSTSAIPAATSDATTADSNQSSGISPTNKKIAIAVPVAVVGLLVVIALLWFFLRRRRRRDELPSYDVATSQTPIVSTSKLMPTPVVAAPDPAASTLPRLPLLDAPETSSSDDQSPGSAGQMSVRSGFEGSQPELGVAVAVPLHHRRSATEQDMHRVSRSASVAGTVTPHLRLPLETPRDDDDAVSVESNERRPEHDLDDMSSVSSFEDDHDRNEHSRTDDRGHWPLRSP